jgi:hypothetical protein
MSDNYVKFVHASIRVQVSLAHKISLAKSSSVYLFHNDKFSYKNFPVELCETVRYVLIPTGGYGVFSEAAQASLTPEQYFEQLVALGFSPVADRVGVYLSNF